MTSLQTVIVNWRSAEMSLAATAAALAAMQGLEGAITLVDNGSGDGSFEAMRDAVLRQGWDRLATPVQVLQSGQNGGFGFGCNFGIMAGLPGGMRPDYVYLLNSDAFPDKDAIRLLRDHLDANPAIGIVGSHIHGEDGTPHQTAFRFPSLAGEFEAHSRIALVSRLLGRWIVPLPVPTTAVAVDWLAGASLMLRRDLLDRIGLFDTRFFLYFEETDLCRRAAQLGAARVYLPESRVAHIGSVSTGMKQWQRMPGFWLDSRLYYFRKTHGRAYAALATFAALAGLGLWQIKRLLSGHRRIDPEKYASDLLMHHLRPRQSPPPSTAFREDFPS